MTYLTVKLVLNADGSAARAELVRTQSAIGALGPTGTASGRRIDAAAVSAQRSLANVGASAARAGAQIETAFAGRGLPALARTGQAIGQITSGLGDVIAQSGLAGARIQHGKSRGRRSLVRPHRRPCRDCCAARGDGCSSRGSLRRVRSGDRGHHHLQPTVTEGRRLAAATLLIPCTAHLMARTEYGRGGNTVQSPGWLCEIIARRAAGA
jgi:hypothetical protein